MGRDVLCPCACPSVISGLPLPFAFAQVHGGTGPTLAGAQQPQRTQPAQQEPLGAPLEPAAAQQRRRLLAEEGSREAQLAQQEGGATAARAPYLFEYEKSATKYLTFVSGGWAGPPLQEPCCRAILLARGRERPATPTLTRMHKQQSSPCAHLHEER